MMKKFNLVNDIDTQVQEAWTDSKKMNPKRPTPRHIIIKTPKVKDEERILKASKEKQLVAYKGAPIRLSADCQKEVARNIQSDENQGPEAKISLLSKVMVYN